MSEKSFKPSLVNPILMFVERFLIDWWLLRVFSIMYKPVQKALRKEIKSVVSQDLVSFIKGKPASSLEYKDYHRSAFEEGLYYAEVTAYKSNPLFWAGLSAGLLLFLISTTSYEIGAGTTYLYLSLSVLTVVGLVKYFKVRFAIYKMHRLVTDA